MISDAKADLAAEAADSDSWAAANGDPKTFLTSISVAASVHRVTATGLDGTRETMPATIATPDLRVKAVPAIRDGRMAARLNGSSQPAAKEMRDAGLIVRSMVIAKNTVHVIVGTGSEAVTDRRSRADRAGLRDQSVRQWKSSQQCSMPSLRLGRS